jgi:hypothetical protein
VAVGPSFIKKRPKDPRNKPPQIATSAISKELNFDVFSALSSVG